MVKFLVCSLSLKISHRILGRWNIMKEKNLHIYLIYFYTHCRSVAPWWAFTYDIIHKIILYRVFFF